MFVSLDLFVFTILVQIMNATFAVISVDCMLVECIN